MEETGRIEQEWGAPFDQKIMKEIFIEKVELIKKAMVEDGLKIKSVKYEWD